MMRWMMLLVLVLGAAGCTPLTTAQMNLVTQARHGIELLSQSARVQQQLSDELVQLRRQRLDEAFDADVRDQTELTADWVIEHRQAYALGMRSLQSAEASMQRTQASLVDNLAATDRALNQMQQLLEIEMRWGQMVPLSTAPSTQQK